MSSILQQAGFEWLWLKRTQICKAGMFSNLQWVTQTTKEDKLPTCGMLSAVLKTQNKVQIRLEGSCQPLNLLMFCTLTDVQDERREKRARRETNRYQRAHMRTREQHRSPTYFSESPSWADEQVYRHGDTSNNAVCLLSQQLFGRNRDKAS